MCSRGCLKVAVILLNLPVMNNSSQTQENPAPCQPEQAKTDVSALHTPAASEPEQVRSQVKQLDAAPCAIKQAMFEDNLIGAACLGVGVWILIDDDSFFDQTSDVLDLQVLGSDLLNQCAIAMIVVGSSVFVLSMLGCAGAVSMSSCLLVFYTLALVLLLTVEVAVLVLAVVFRSELLDKTDEVVEDKFMTKYGNNTTFTSSFDVLQKEFDCCGWKSGDDYGKITSPDQWKDPQDPREVPNVCCGSSNTSLVDECVVKPMNNTIYHDKGCKDAVEDKFETYIWVIIGVVAGLLLFQFLLMIFALSLVVQNGGKKYDMA